MDPYVCAAIAIIAYCENRGATPQEAQSIALAQVWPEETTTPQGLTDALAAIDAAMT